MNNKLNEDFSSPRSKKSNDNAVQFLTKSSNASSSNTNAWSDPVKSVNLVKYPKQNPNNIVIKKEDSKVNDLSVNKAWSDPTKSIQLVNDRIPGSSGIGRPKQNIGSSGERNPTISAHSKQQQVRILPKPVTPQKLSSKETTEAPLNKDKISEDKNKNDSEADLEVKRELRRERRRRTREFKKRQKEEEKRVAIQSSKDTKIKLINADIINKVKSNNHSGVDNLNNTDKPSSSNNEKLRFFDEEYPTLDEKKSKSKTLSNTILSKSKEKCLESGSEWETEDENEFLISKNLIEGAAVNLENEIVPQIIQNEETGPVNKSYSSILKSLSNKKSAGKVRKSSNPVINELSDELIKAKSVSKNKDLILLPTSNSSTLLTKPDMKKVKKKDPIRVDIFEAAKVKKKIEIVQKPSVVHGSKIKKTGGNVSTITTPQVRNVLDASAPTKRRGKEREKPKRKKPTTLKKLILQDREKRSLERQLNLILSAEKQKDTETVIIVDQKPEIVSNSDDLAKNIHENILKEPQIIELPKQSVQEKAKLQIHSRKFRSYCDHDLSRDMDEIVSNLVKDLVRFQDRQHAENPIKAKARRRYVVGLREIKKFMTVKKITMLLLAPDVEQMQSKGGLDDIISELIKLAKENEIPYIFTLNRWKLGKCCLRKVPISGIGILNHQGSEENVKQILNLLSDLRLTYEEKLSQAIKNVTE